jgi:uncharacterized SAM-binding protein YcdF (DUF218 family)
MLGSTGSVATGCARLVRAHRPWSRRRRIAVGVLALLMVLFSVTTARLYLWPPLPPLPDHADAIIELGGPGNRDAAAIALARQGRAPVLVQSTTAGDAATGRCLSPMPGVTILCFHADPNTTLGEARAIAALARQYGWRSVILVTSRDHAWRARLRVGRCFGGDIYVSMTGPAPLYWLRQIPYQWVATVKALTVNTSC